MRVTRGLVTAGCWTFLLFGGVVAHAQTFKGVGTCGGSECHSRSGEVDWLGKQPGGKEHRESLRRLKGSADVSEKYAKAVGLDNVFEPKGMCLECHGTYIEAAKTTEGVGCEGCHGAAGNYRDFHARTPKDYRGAVGRGMRDLQGKPTAWTRVCKDCHVLSDKPEYVALLDAGHKEGNRWKPQDKYTGVQAHWKRVSYKVDVVAAAAAGKPVTVAVAPTPTPTPTPEPAPPPAAPGPTTPPPGAPAGTPAKFSPAGSATSPAGKTTRPEPAPAPATVPPPMARPADPIPAPAPADPRMSGTAPGMPSPLGLVAPPPVTPAELLAALQSRVAGFFTRLLGSNVTPDVPLKPLPAPAGIAGPDEELLRLQAEALALAIEALNLKVKTARPPSEK
ncbi:MAG TPA: hypothetical protein VJ813_21070 [Vicinamibacterales bacterium]|nr:hypothetical protein [Vicinamibacterales bacterium]